MVQNCLAYAMSIHKSQEVSFPLSSFPSPVPASACWNAIIYTATRAKSKLILLGELQAFDYAVKHIGTARKTYLIERFSDLIENNIEESKQAFLKLPQQVTLNNPTSSPRKTGLVFQP